MKLNFKLEANKILLGYEMYKENVYYQDDKLFIGRGFKVHFLVLTVYFETTTEAHADCDKGYEPEDGTDEREASPRIVL